MDTHAVSHPPPGVTAPRIIVPGATTAITRRTTLRKAFLAPWYPGVKKAWLYAMALAQSHTRVAIHHATLVVNHHHVTGTPEDDQLPLFLGASRAPCARPADSACPPFASAPGASWVGSSTSRPRSRPVRFARSTARCDWPEPPATTSAFEDL
jgi:hypothetical protein